VLVLVGCRDTCREAAVARARAVRPLPLASWEAGGAGAPRPAAPLVGESDLNAAC